MARHVFAKAPDHENAQRHSPHPCTGIRCVFLCLQEVLHEEVLQYSAQGKSCCQESRCTIAVSPQYSSKSAVQVYKVVRKLVGGEEQGRFCLNGGVGGSGGPPPPLRERIRYPARRKIVGK